jgi:protein-disulfide isomerase
MNRRSIVLSTLAVAAVVFAGGAHIFNQRMEQRRINAAGANTDVFVRAHSPVIGPADAPVTIIELLDPSCEACRAFYPLVKQIMGEFPGKVRLVVRYTPFHEGSDEAVRILEASRKQGKFEPVLETMFARQPEWAVHGAPVLDVAWQIAGDHGVDLSEARKVAASPEITAVLDQDVSDVKTLGIGQTPTFFVNGKPLPKFGAQELYDLVASEVRAAK